MEIGKVIRELRREAGMKQSDLAKLLYLSADTISCWELGKSFPSIESIIKLTKIFGVTSDYLLGIEK